MAEKKEFIFYKLKTVHSELEILLSNVGEDIFSLNPSPDSWSIKHVMQHLILVEEAFCKKLLTAKHEEKQRPLLLKTLLPISIVGLPPIIKIKAPDAVNPKMNENKNLSSMTKEDIVAKWQQNLKNLNAAYSQLSFEEWKLHHVKHPNFGMLDGNMAIKFLAYHAVRHKRQIQSLLDSKVNNI